MGFGIPERKTAAVQLQRHRFALARFQRHLCEGFQLLFGPFDAASGVGDIELDDLLAGPAAAVPDPYRHQNPAFALHPVLAGDALVGERGVRQSVAEGEDIRNAVLVIPPVSDENAFRIGNVDRLAGTDVIGKALHRVLFQSEPVVFVLVVAVPIGLASDVVEPRCG